MIRWVIEVSAVTTSHPVALASTARFATFVWALAHPENRSALKGIDWPTDRVPGDVWKATTRALRIMKDKGEPSLLEYVRSTGWLNKELTCAAGGFSLSGFAWVVDRAFRAVSFEHALIEICASGGDTDTVGAMVGCLAALRFGESGIPLWMVRGLLNYGEIQAPEVWTPSSEDVLTRWENEYRAQKMAEATVKNLTEAINKP
jgi:ADP-ribosylglycohydrolase